MRRPEGFDERPDRPAAGPDVPAADDVAPARGRRFGRGRPRPGAPALPLSAAGPDEQVEPTVRRTPADGLEAPLPSDTTADDARAVASRDRASRMAGVAGRRLGAGFSSVAGRLRELSPDEEYVAPDAARSRHDDDQLDRTRGDHPRGDDTADDADAARADRPGTVTDVLDLTRASRPDDGEADGTEPIGSRVRAAETAREARVARRRRRLLERAEVRRFTRRSRHRRAAWITTGGVVLVLALSILVAVFSPLMALRTIEVKGASRVDAAQVREALSDQLGTPLARLDFAEVKKDLAAFPLIESYVTEEAPPHTLVVTITERSPIVAVKSGSGYDLVDPAGIVVQSTPRAPGTMPVADISSARLGSGVFRTMTEVVLALPSTVRTQVTEVTASTADDVTLTMRDGSKVVWGSPDASTQKAALLSALVKDHASRDPGTPVEYDVSAPDNGIVRSQG